jgi:hypothetical protein
MTGSSARSTAAHAAGGGVFTGLGSGRCSLRRAAALGLLAAPDGDGEPLLVRCADRRGGADEAEEHQRRAQQLAQAQSAGQAEAAKRAAKMGS